MNDKDNKPPERIYLQCYESDGSLRDFINDDITWCVDQINDSDAVYTLAPSQPPRTELTMTYIRAPKRACPRDLGFWYCCDCTKEHLEEQSCLDFPIPIHGCGKPFGGKICGETHLGYEWCKECQATGRTKPHSHIGEFEIVGEMHDDLL